MISMRLPISPAQIFAMSRLEIRPVKGVPTIVCVSGSWWMEKIHQYS
jgi:hypothetical protein